MKKQENKITMVSNYKLRIGCLFLLMFIPILHMVFVVKCLNIAIDIHITSQHFYNYKLLE